MTFTHLNDLPKSEPVPGYKGRFVHTDNMTIAFWDVAKGAAVPVHSHPHEQVATVIEGEFELTVDGETQLCKPGDAAVIPGNVPHSGRAITACKLIDVFHPSRDDYR